MNKLSGKHVGKFFSYLLIAFLTCMLLSSCSELEMVDSSSDPAFQLVIGKKFILKTDLLALGISSDNTSPADYVVLVPGVGFSGPEVVSRSMLNKGAVIQVTKVLTAKSLLSSKVAYVVKEIDSNQLINNEIRITVVGKSDDETFGLDANSYRVEKSGRRQN